MTQAAGLQTFLISPKQAHNIYAQAGAYPKQRHAFLVRFNKAGGTAATTPQMTYAVKSTDRPAIQPTVEEVNQYNKKRQVYTGYKKSPVKCTFYDDAAGSAQLMWSDYAKYYFGDFSIADFAVGNPNAAFLDDLVTGHWGDSGSDFGFTGRNNATGQTNQAAGAQWYFRSIDILHFHNTVYDLYSLLNPRLVSWAPDELDYETAAVGLINAEFVYEALIFTPNMQAAATQPEFSGAFADGTKFNSAVPAGATTAVPSPGTTGRLAQVAQAATQGAAGIEQLFGGQGAASSNPSDPAGYGGTNGYDSNGGYGSGDYRATNTPATGGLGVFGNFIFGRNSKGGVSGQLNVGLTALAAANPALAATLNIGGGLGGNPLAANVPLGAAGMAAGFAGVPPQYPGVVAGLAGALNTRSGSPYAAQGYGGIVQQLARGVLANSFAGGLPPGGPAGGFLGGGGVTLSPGAYGVINAQGGGTAQYGYNPATTAAGALYGYQGPAGVGTPTPGGGLGAGYPGGYADGAANAGDPATRGLPGQGYGGAVQTAPLDRPPLLAVSPAPVAAVTAAPLPPLPPTPDAAAQTAASAESDSIVEAGDGGGDPNSGVA